MNNKEDDNLDKNEEDEFPGHIKYSFLVGDLIGHMEFNNMFYFFQAEPIRLRVLGFELTAWKQKEWAQANSLN